jgi:tetratricopeptide (TPR) repeat protein
MCLGLLVYAYVLRKRGEGRAAGLAVMDLLLLVFYFFYFLSCVLSDYPDVSITAVLGEFPFILAYVFFRITFAARPGSAKSFAVFLSVGLAGLTLWGLLQYFFEIDVTRGLKSLFKTHHYPIIASMGNPNFLAEYLTLAMPAAMSFLFAGYGKGGTDGGPGVGGFRRRLPPAGRLFSHALLVGGGLVVFLTYSRLAWAAFLVMLALVIMFTEGKERARMAALALLMAVMAASFFLYQMNTGSTKPVRILNLFSRPDVTISSGREIIYETGFRMLKEGGLTGKGPGAFGYLYLDYQGAVAREMKGDRLKYRFFDLDHAHSDFIEMGVDSGYGALLAYAALLLYAMASGIRNIRAAEKGDYFKYMNMVPLLFIIFGTWAFPFYLPFSKLVLYLSLAYLAVRPGGRTFRVSLRVIAPLFLFLAVAMTFLHTRYTVSAIRYKAGLAHFAIDMEKALEHFQGGIRIYPYNGYNHFSSGALLLNYDYSDGIACLRESLKYLNNSACYLYIAEGYRDMGDRAAAKRWYETLLEKRPDIMKARKEYRELLDREKKERQKSGNENKN